MSQGYELSIITINYNGLEDTCQMLSSISLGDVKAQVIVVDNGSSADEARAVRERFPWVEVCATHENLGFAGGNNVGISKASGKYLFFVNNDTLLSQCDFRGMLNRLENDPGIGGMSPLIRFHQQPQAVQYAGYTRLSAITLRNRAIGFGDTGLFPYRSERLTPYLHGAAMLVRREAVEKAGRMPDCYFLYYEELDWSVAIRHQGYRLLYFPGAVVFHKESQSTGADSPLKLYYNTRNRFLFSRRNNSRACHLMACIYMMAMVIPKQTVKLLCRRRLVHLRYLYRAVSDFFRGQYGRLK
ncbi:MAG: glycosyltransferase family 2 protein [Prevotella sp.]